MTEPTHTELRKLAEESGIGWAAGLGGMDDFLRAFSRAVLAKWGTPPAVEGEPVATLHCNDIGYVWARVTDSGKQLRFEEPMNLYTTPQPTQAQAGAVPLTADEREALWESHGPTRVKWGHWEWHQQGIEDAERHHGIKGGQHGDGTT